MQTDLQSQRSVISAISEALSRFTMDSDGPMLTDIHLQPDADAGEVRIYDDDDQLLAKADVSELAADDGEDFYAKAETLLRASVRRMKDDGALEGLTLVKPYSFVLIDEDRETVAELMLVDDEETLLLDGELLKGLDEELDAFLTDLMK